MPFLSNKATESAFAGDPELLADFCKQIPAMQMEYARALIIGENLPAWAEPTERALMLASRADNVHVIRSLARAGWFRTPLGTEHAIRAMSSGARVGRVSSLAALIEALEGTPELRQAFTRAIFFAADTGHSSSLSFLLAEASKRGLLSLRMDRDGDKGLGGWIDYPLQAAAVFPSVECARLLVEAGVDPSHPDHNGLTPLQKASVRAGVLPYSDAAVERDYAPMLAFLREFEPVRSESP
jgi:hypothetical protein